MAYAFKGSQLTHTVEKVKETRDEIRARFRSERWRLPSPEVDPNAPMLAICAAPDENIKSKQLEE